MVLRRAPLQSGSSASPASTTWPSSSTPPSTSSSTSPAGPPSNAPSSTCSLGGCQCVRFNSKLTNARVFFLFNMSTRQKWHISMYILTKTLIYFQHVQRKGKTKWRSHNKNGNYTNFNPRHLPVNFQCNTMSYKTIVQKFHLKCSFIFISQSVKQSIKVL